MIRRPPRSTLFPTRRSSDLVVSWVDVLVVLLAVVAGVSGWRHGMAVALLSFVGVLGGAVLGVQLAPLLAGNVEDRKSTRLNSSHANISYAVFCLKKNKQRYS